MTLRKFKINQIIFGLALLALIVTTSSCKQNPDTQKDDDSKKTVVTSPEGFGFIFIEETTEKLDGKDYTVKAYADSYGAPYLFDYYKYYYLDGKLKKIHVYYHNTGKSDYTYEEFKNYIKENSDFGIYEEKIYTYYDNGRLQEMEVWMSDEYVPNWHSEFYSHYNVKYYDNEKNTIKSETNDKGGTTYYYQNGKAGLNFYYDGNSFELSFYYESGYTCYYYSGESQKLRFWEDGVYKNRGGDYGSWDDCTSEAYTQEQAIALCNQLIQEHFN